MSQKNNNSKSSISISATKRVCKTFDPEQKEYISQGISRKNVQLQDSHQLKRLMIKFANEFFNTTGRKFALSRRVPSMILSSFTT